MADFILGRVVDATVSKVIVAASEQLNLVWGWKEDLKRFHLIMKMLGGVLQDANEKHVIGHPLLRGWLEELQAVAEEAENMLEEVAYHNLRRQAVFSKSNWKKVSYLFTPSNHHPLLFRLRMGNRVKSLNVFVADIFDWATRMGLQYKFADTIVPMPIVDRETTVTTHSSLVYPSCVIGRENDIVKIVSLLTDSSEEALSVISVWGTPGLGKTTLATAVCETDKIQKYFGKNIMWVSVSINFDVQRILQKMVESLIGTPCTLKEKGHLLNKLSKELEKNEVKKYLLILDDVWNEDSGKWDVLRRCLLSIRKKPGNRVVVITRSEKVASTMGTLPKHMHRLEQLKGSACWAIIKGRAFGNAIVPPELNTIGKGIGSKCGGLPFVAAVIGGTLCNDRDKGKWVSVESKMNALSSSVDPNARILHTLQLSFDQLQKLDLKRCFVFCSIFPRDFVMERDVLIQLWMAEGYLQPSKGNSMEDMGVEYFDLLSHSPFQEEERDYLGNIISCKMHDLIYDFAKSVTRFETVILNGLSGTLISNRVQHLSLTHGVPTNLGDVAPKLCTLFSNHGFPDSMGATKFKRLRVLSFCNASDVKHLPTCFRNSKSLRYLDISGTQIEELPKFITKLYNLQTFRFMNCKSLKKPLIGIGDLINLRHVYFDDEERMPANLGRLTNLQTLPLFFVSTTKGCKIEELGSLRGLKGRLEIRKLQLVRDKLEARKAKLHEKAVDVVELCWRKEGNRDKLDEEVLEGLQPHSNIRKLSIEGYGGGNLASWMLKSSEESLLLNNLVELRISNCKMLCRIPGINGFSFLQRLSVDWCNELISFGDGDRALAFRSLKQLSIGWCPKLESFSVSGLLSLEQLQLRYCDVLSSIGYSLSSSTCLKQLYLHNCPKLKFIPSLEGLVSLKLVTIKYCGELECLPNGLSSCTALEELEIQGCSNLVSIPEELKQLRYLVKLDMLNCQKLRSFPEDILGSLARLKKLELGPFSKELEEFPNLSSTSTLASLEQLCLEGWGQVTLPHQIQCLTALTDLTIRSFNEVGEASMGNLSCLKTLEIRDCTWLRCLLGGPSSLEELVITNCPNLVSFQGKLKELHSLIIENCPELVGFLEESLACCTRLKRLEIGPFSNELEEFPSLSSICTSLEELELLGWEKLTHIPQIQHLTTLKELSIKGFSGMKSLPDWFKNLSSLQLLCIQYCPELEKRCTEGSRPDWHKIAHIPNIKVGWKTIQSED